jgi:hypothetical protein
MLFYTIKDSRIVAEKKLKNTKDKARLAVLREMRKFHGKKIEAMHYILSMLNLYLLDFNLYPAPILLAMTDQDFEILEKENQAFERWRRLAIQKAEILQKISDAERKRRGKNAN